MMRVIPIIVTVLMVTFYSVAPVSASSNIQYSGALSCRFSSELGSSFTSSLAVGDIPFINSDWLATQSSYWTPNSGVYVRGFSCPSPSITTTNGKGVMMLISFFTFMSSSSSRTSQFSSTSTPSAYSFSASYQNSAGVVYAGKAGFTTFDARLPDSGSYYYAGESSGISCYGIYEGESVSDFLGLEIEIQDGAVGSYCIGSYSSSWGGHIYITDARLVPYDPESTDADLLIDIANAVVDQTEVMSAYYGSIVAICNQIYSRLGDIQATIETVSTIIEKIESEVSQIKSITNNIYSTLSSFMTSLLGLVASESDDIQQTILDAEKLLETYLKPIIDYFNELEDTTGESADSLPGHKTDLDGFASSDAGINSDAVSGLPTLILSISSIPFIMQILGMFIGGGIFLLIIKKGLS